MDCPKCLAANPDSARFCGLCAAPLRPDEPSTARSLPKSARPASSRPVSHTRPPPSTPPVKPPAVSLPPSPHPAEPPSSTPPSTPSDAPSLTTTIDPLSRGLLPGSVVAGKYRILGEIGRGGMGIVYEADDLWLRRPVALKFLPVELTDDIEARERFVHEAQAASVLDHPHICTIHEIGESEHGQMFIAMALCNGESLRTKIKRGPLPPAEALSFAAHVAEGLAAAHASGIVHRDVKPANILITKDGTARVVDFGLAKIAGEARLTQAGRAVGTVAYMSPEQLRGDDVDSRSDIWSLGVVLYEMLTGALPFAGANEHSLAYAIVNIEPKPLSDLPPGTPDGCVRILEKSIAKDPDARFASAVEMAEAISDVRESAGYSGRLRAGSGSSPSSRPGERATRAGEGHPRQEAARRRPALVRFGLPFLSVAAVFSVAFALGLPRRATQLLGLARPSGARHITVFPPNVIGDNPEDRVLAAGLADYLRTSLDRIARASRSWVTPGSHLETYEVREAADALRVLGSNVVLSGTLKRAGGSVSLVLDVIDPKSYRRGASISKTDHIANITTWQVDVVLEAAAALGLPLAPSARGALISSGTTVPGAFESHVRGLGFMASAYDGAGRRSAGNADLLASAVAAFEEAVRLDPSFTEARLDLADALWRGSAPEESGEPAAPALRAETIVRDVLKAHDLAPAHAVLGSILRKLGRDDEAVLEYIRATEIDPLYYSALIWLGDFYADKNQPAKAEAAYRAALQVRPGYWSAGAYLGYFYLYQGAYAEARDEFERVSRACPGNVVMLNNLGAALYFLGDVDRAVSAFERSNAVKRNPDATSNLAVLYYYQGRYADSVTMNETAIGYGRSELDYLIYGNLADACRFTPGHEAKSAEAYGKAIALAEKALAADPGNPRLRASLATYLAKTGVAERAQAEIESARKAKPDDSSIALKAVIVFELNGARPRALEAVRDYVRLKGRMEEIQRDPFLAAIRRDPGYADITKTRRRRS